MSLKVYSWDDLPLEQMSEDTQRRFAHGQNLTLAQFIIKKGTLVPAHSHPNEQATMILKGKIRLDFETGESLTINEGEFVIIPPNVMHSGEVLEDTLDLDAFAPARSDWVGETPSYYAESRRKTVE